MTALELELEEINQDLFKIREKVYPDTFEGLLDKPAKIRKGASLRPKTPCPHNVGFIYDGDKYVLWEDKEPHPEDFYEKCSNPRKWINWIDNRYRGDPIGELRKQAGYGGITPPLRYIFPRFGPRGPHPRLLNLEFLSEAWFRAWDNYNLA